MFDGAVSLQYAPDPVSDDDQEEELVHVRLHGEREWHRRAVGGLETGCGRDLFADADHRISRVARTRGSSYRGPLCTTCFTSFELAKSSDLTQTDD